MVLHTLVFWRFHGLDLWYSRTLMMKSSDLLEYDTV
jgi:hypothetical protein